MTDYKLVPVAMVDADDDGMWADILPNVTVKVGQILYTAPQPSFQLPEFATDPDDSDEVASLWDHGFKRGWNSCLGAVAKAMQPLPCQECGGDGAGGEHEEDCAMAHPAEQQPAPDVAALVESLEEARRELNSCQSVIHYAGGFDPAYVTGAQAALVKIDAALAAHRKQGGEQA